MESNQDIEMKEPIQDIEMEVPNHDFVKKEENLVYKASISKISITLHIPNNINISNSIPLQENPEEIPLNLEMSLSNEPNYNIKNIEELDFLLEIYSS